MQKKRNKNPLPFIWESPFYMGVPYEGMEILVGKLENLNETLKETNLGEAQSFFDPLKIQFLMPSRSRWPTQFGNVFNFVTFNLDG